MDIKYFQNKYKENKALEEKNSLEERMLHARESGDNMSVITSDLSYYTLLSNNISLIQKYISEYISSKELINTDSELKELAQIEIEELEEKIPTLDEEINKMQIDRKFHDIDDNKSAIIEIRAGAGGDEASLFAADLFRMYTNYANSKDWRVSIVESTVSEGNGYKEVVANITGNDVFKYLKYESGVHRVQRIPTTEASGRIHTSTASVAILPEAKDIDIQINPEDLKVEVMRASGAGGQCVNRTDSAVRITHIPTGIVVSCQETKHQSQNKEKAMALLRSRLYEKKRLEEHAKRDSLRLSQIGSAMRAEKIRTYNYPQNRITDHRIKKSWFNIEQVLGGDLDEIVEDVRHGIQLELLENEK